MFRLAAVLSNNSGQPTSEQRYTTTTPRAPEAHPANETPSNLPPSRTAQEEGSRSHRSYSPRSALPLSMQVIKHVSGFYCLDCSAPSRASSLYGRGRDNDDNIDDNMDATQALLTDYDLPALRRQGTAASPWVLAPMMAPSSNAAQASTTLSTNPQTERILSEYIAACRFYGCADRINAGVLTTLRFQLPCLRPSGSFHDADMLALVEVLLRYINGPLRYIKRLDFSIASKEGKLHGKAGFRSHGAFALSKVLQVAEHVEEVLLQRNQIGPYGASAIFIACSSNAQLKRLGMRRCLVGERGALTFAEYIVHNSECGLVEVDLSANHIGFRGSLAIDHALLERHANYKLDNLRPMLLVDLEGNLVFQEVMNCLTHFLGIVLAMLGAWVLSKQVQGRSTRHVISAAIYSVSLLVLYTSSTLYHSLFTLRNTKWVFEVVDKCAIYILIAGSYTPFLQIVLAHEPLWSVYLFSFLWICCLVGIYVEATCPAWQYRAPFSLVMYLCMGWSAVGSLPEVSRILPLDGMHLMVLGGVAYTAGVPFFVRNNNLDHAIWHLFVLAGSTAHWLGLYYYVFNMP